MGSLTNNLIKKENPNSSLFDKVEESITRRQSHGDKKSHGFSAKL